MAKTVNQFSTIEDFRKKYNELAIDVGDKSGLRMSKLTPATRAPTRFAKRAAPSFARNKKTSHASCTGVDNIDA